MSEFAPDIETATENYASRFKGPVGEFFLNMQADSVRSLLFSSKPLSVLEVGGGHGQLTPLFLELGHCVCIHGSAIGCMNRVAQYRERHPDRVSFVVSPIESLPFPDRAFDVVVAFRLMAHIENWRRFVAELARVTDTQLILEYASILGFNALTPLLFQIKKRIEGNTRPYFCHSLDEIERVVKKHSFQRCSAVKQFFLPMGIHRLLENVSLSKKTETFFAAVGMTGLFGSPVIVSVKRK
jgi:SAM-dependent methyltransferase